MRGAVSLFRWAVLLLAVAALLSTAGCYYLQAAHGQWQVMTKRQPIGDVVEDAATPEALAERLRLVQTARQFSIDELGLPDNGSYRSFADIEREFVVWNVFAAAEFSLQAKRWCFPVAGCVSYRGYFSEKAARREAVGGGAAAVWSSSGDAQAPRRKASARSWRLLLRYSGTSSSR